MAMNDATSDDSSSNLEITVRVARYAYDRLTYAGQAYAVGVGTAAVWTLGAIEGSLHLQSTSASSSSSKQAAARFVSRYASYNVIPSLIWGTHSSSAIVASGSAFLKHNSSSLIYTSINTLPPKRILWIRILCALRGAVAGSVVLANVMAVTSTWQRAQQDYADRILQGRESPLNDSSRKEGCTLRLAGVTSDVTKLSMHRRGPGRIWPIFEDHQQVQELVHRYGGGGATYHDRNKQAFSELLPRRPVYWQVEDGNYSKASSWDGMQIPAGWLFTVKGKKKKLLYLEADATAGDESALALQHGSAYYKKDDHGAFATRTLGGSNGTDKDVSLNFPDLDLDLKEVAQGFRRLADIARNGQGEDESLAVMRVLLVDPTLIIESGGGRRNTVRDRVEELGLTDIIVDARASVLKAILLWLESNETGKEKTSVWSRSSSLKPVILETPSKAWFHSIRSELYRHGFHVMDRAEASSHEAMPPLLVYERSGADTVNTIRQYVERGIVKDPARVCGLLTSHDGLDEMKSLNESLGEDSTVGCVCSSDIHDRVLEWVRYQSLLGVSAASIQEDLDAGRAWEEA